MTAASGAGSTDCRDRINHPQKGLCPQGQKRSPAHAMKTLLLLVLGLGGDAKMYRHELTHLEAVAACLVINLRSGSSQQSQG
jgi:hypothetical protein